MEAWRADGGTEEVEDPRTHRRTQAGLGQESEGETVRQNRCNGKCQLVPDAWRRERAVLFWDSLTPAISGLLLGTKQVYMTN